MLGHRLKTYGDERTIDVKIEKYSTKINKYIFREGIYWNFVFLFAGRSVCRFIGLHDPKAFDFRLIGAWLKMIVFSPYVYMWWVGLLLAPWHIALCWQKTFSQMSVFTRPGTMDNMDFLKWLWLNLVKPRSTDKVSSLVSWVIIDTLFSLGLISCISSTLRSHSMNQAVTVLSWDKRGSSVPWIGLKSPKMSTMMLVCSSKATVPVSSPPSSPSDRWYSCVLCKHHLIHYMKKKELSRDCLLHRYQLLMKENDTNLTNLHKVEHLWTKAVLSQMVSHLLLLVGIDMFLG